MTVELIAPDTGIPQTSWLNADIDGAIAEGTGWPWYFISITVF
jgi:hypothetical protein